MQSPPTIERPAFVAKGFADDYGPIPDWLHPTYDWMYDGYYIATDSPEAKEARISRLKAVIEGWFE